MTLIAFWSLENSVPVIVFAEKYLDQGALLSISAQPADIGSKAAILTKNIVEGKAVARMSDVDIPRLRINESGKEIAYRDK